ncbi:MAG: LysM peptidoglycan-binding domain-containing protein [Bacillota bacterium]
MKRQESSPCSSGVYWVVAAGDTLYKIAIAAKVDLEELLRVNPNIDPRNLQIGQEICLPEGGQLPPDVGEVPDCPGGFFWEIAAGDTIFKIARDSNTTVEKILALNPRINPYNLRIGQFICIPPR